MEAVARDRRLAGRYVLQRSIASGGMADVWLARDQVLARPVAVKILRRDLADDPDFLRRFRREAIAAAALTHPCITRVFDTGLDQGICYIVLEHVQGRTLQEILAEEGAQEPARAVALTLPVLGALEAAHEAGIVHRDIKPGNILVGSDGRVKVADFGIAKALHGANLTTTGQVLGTVRYLSPEQVEGVEVDPRSDLYSAGVVLYELLTGRPPFSAETDVATAMMRLTADPPRPRDIRATIPRALEAAVMKAMARRPEDRHQSAASLRTSLERMVETERPRAGPGRSPRAPAPAPAPASVFRSWMLAPLILILLAAAAILAGLSIGRLQLGGPLGVRPADRGGGSPAPAPALRPIAVEGAADFDPQGDDRAENHDTVPLAVDGDPATAWSTDHYNSAAFGGLKNGLGLWLALEGEPTVARLTLVSPVGGWQFQVRAGSSPQAADRVLRSADGRSTFTTGPPGPTSIRLQPVRTAGVMIWITRLAPDQGRYAATIADVTLAGSPG